MKKNRLFALLMAMTMTVSLLAGCGGKTEPAPAAPDGGAATPAPEATVDKMEGPLYDEWSEKTDEELYKLAQEENNTINVYAVSSSMLKEIDLFKEAYPDLKVEVFDMDQDDALSKVKIEAETHNVTADVVQAKDVNGNVFYEYYENGIITPFYPKDICEKMDPAALRFGYPLYASQSFWFYNTAAFPEGQPINNWWQIIETKEDGTQKYRLFTKEIGQETAYLSLFCSFVNNADEMEKAYKDAYGKDLEYTYDASSFPFEVPEKNAGIEYLWRFSQMKLTFIGDGDELVLAVNNSTKDDPALCLASAGKIKNRDESGYSIDWVMNLAPYTGLQNFEYMYLAAGTDSPAGARLFIRFVTGGADGKSGGLKPFSKQGQWPIRTDVSSDWNPASLPETGAIVNNLAEIYDIFLDVQDMWTFWLSKNPNM